MSDKAKSSLENLSDNDVFVSVEELEAYVTEIEMAKARKSLEAQNRADEAKQELLRQLRSDEPISEERLRAFTLRVKAAADAGQSELLLGRFPSEHCTDHGRAINMAEPGWPETPVGRPRQAYLVWKEKLQPLGYQLKARIAAWPEGVPGYVGLYLSWNCAEPASCGNDASRFQSGLAFATMEAPGALSKKRHAAVAMMGRAAKPG